MLFFLLNDIDIYNLEKAIKDYINWYYSDRVCKKLKGMSPTNFRKQALNCVSITQIVK